MCLKPAIFWGMTIKESWKRWKQNIQYKMAYKKPSIRCSNSQWLSLSCPVKQPAGAVEINLLAISPKRIGINPTSTLVLRQIDRCTFYTHVRSCPHAMPCVRPISSCPSTWEADFWKCPFWAYIVYSRVPLWRTCRLSVYFYFCYMLLWSPNHYQSIVHLIYCINYAANIFWEKSKLPIAIITLSEKNPLRITTTIDRLIASFVRAQNYLIFAVFELWY